MYPGTQVVSGGKAYNQRKESCLPWSKASKVVGRVAATRNRDGRAFDFPFGFLGDRFTSCLHLLCIMHLLLGRFPLTLHGPSLCCLVSCMALISAIRQIRQLSLSGQFKRRSNVDTKLFCNQLPPTARNGSHHRPPSNQNTRSLSRSSVFSLTPSPNPASTSLLLLLQREEGDLSTQTLCKMVSRKVRSRKIPQMPDILISLLYCKSYSTSWNARRLSPHLRQSLQFRTQK